MGSLTEPVILALDEGSPELWDVIFKLYENCSAESCKKFTSIYQGIFNLVNPLKTFNCQKMIFLKP